MRKTGATPGRSAGNAHGNEHASTLILGAPTWNGLVSGAKGADVAVSGRALGPPVEEAER